MDAGAGSLALDAATLFERGDLHGARRAADAATAIHLGNGHTWRAARLAPLRTRILLALGDVDAAEIAATEGIEILGGTGDARDVAELHVARGLAWAARGHRDAAESAFLEANRLRRAIDVDAVGLDLMFGELALALGQPELAQKALDRALPDASDDEAAGVHRLQAEIFYARGQIGPAMGERGRALRLALAADERASVTEDLLAVSELLGEAGRPGRAQLYAEEALALASRSHLERIRSLARVRLGQVAEERGDREAAACSYRAAVADGALNQGPEHYWAHVGLWRIGGLCGVHVDAQPDLPGFEAGEPAVTPRTVEAAALVARTLLERGDRAGAADALERVGALLRSNVPPSVAWRVHHLLGTTWSELGAVVKSRDHHTQALGGLELLRTDLAGQSLRLEMASVRRPVYVAAVDAWIGRSVPPPPAEHRERAFGAAQSLKARGVLDLLRVDAHSVGAQEAVDMRAERGLLRVLAEADPVSPERLEVLGSLPELWSSERARARSTSPSRVEDIAAALPDGTLLAEFLLGERVSYLWLVDSDGVRLVYLPGRQAMDPVLAAYQRTLLAPRMTREEQASHLALGARLSQMLFGEALPEVLAARRLVVAGDGALHGLPFAALAVSERLRSGAPDYLVRHLPVIQVPSGSAWMALSRRPRRETPYALDLLGVSDPSLVDGRAPLRVDVEFGDGSVTFVTSNTDGARLPPLPHARRELGAIAKLQSPGRTLTLHGDAATESAVLHAAPDGARYVHFATHGLSDAMPRLPDAAHWVERAEEPALVLTPDAYGDGLLGVDEIMGWGLQAELVVLSGCSTGRGWAERGEDSYGLSAAFLHGGSRRVVASLWSVADRQTHNLMVRFYRELRRGLRPDDALRVAQLHLLMGSAGAHDHVRGVEGITSVAPTARPAQGSATLAPYYWAPFVVIGD